MKKQSRRLGRVMRWWVYACTGVLLVLFVCSFIVNPTLSIDRYPTTNRQGIVKRDLAASYGRIVLFKESDPFAIFHHRSEMDLPENRHIRYDPDGFRSGWHIRFRIDRGMWQGMWQVKPEWWGLPKVKRAANGRAQFDAAFIPLTYPLFLLLALSLYMRLKNRSGIPVGDHCSCGYSLEGLTGNTCPECGNPTKLGAS